MKYSIHYFFFGVLFLAAAILLRFGIAPLTQRLPADYSQKFLFDAQIRFRDSPKADWQNYEIIAKRIDQTLKVSGNISIIQSDTRWMSSSSGLIFEGSGIYGVDRQSNENVAGYGNVPRSGQFLFPHHLQPATYDYWDTNFIGKRVATFNHAELLNGMNVFVFDFSGLGLDETAGYAYLLDVPEKYLAYTDGQGKLWIEPVSGTIVNYEEKGESYFVTPNTKERVANFYEWSAHFTPEVQKTQFDWAQASRLRILLVDTWLPIAFLLLGLACFCFGFWPSRQRSRQPAGGDA